MPATPARIGFIMQEFRRTAVESATIKARYGSKARQTADPIPTYFDSATDAATVAAARQALLGTERRRFRVSLNGASAGLGLTYVGAAPKVRYVDSERSANLAALGAEISVDLGRDNTTLMIWG